MVDAIDVIVLSMRPPQREGAVRGLPFRDDQIVLSCIAGTSLSEVAALCAPAEACRVLPVPTDRFLAVSCSLCGYTEFYNLAIPVHAEEPEMSRRRGLNESTETA